MRKYWLAATLLACLSSSAAADPSGDWLVANGKAVIRIEPCSDALCGTVVWTNAPPADPTTIEGSKPDSGVGVTILQGLRPNGSDRWEGRVFNPENGKTYDAVVALKSANVLRVDGCVLGGWACGGENWKRVKCEEAAAGRTSGSAQREQIPADRTVRKTVISCHAAGP